MHTWLKKPKKCGLHIYTPRMSELQEKKGVDYGRNSLNIMISDIISDLFVWNWIVFNSGKDKSVLTLERKVTGLHTLSEADIMWTIFITELPSTGTFLNSLLNWPLASLLFLSSDEIVIKGTRCKPVWGITNSSNRCSWRNRFQTANDTIN